MKSQNKVVPLFQSTDSIRIGDTVIHIDEDGRYRLNDFHKANGVLNKHRPKYFLATEQAKDMISELSKGGIPPLDSVHGGAKKGTYVVKELVYAYAMWADAKFAVHVIQTFDRVSKQEHAEVKRLTDQIASKRYQEISPDCLKGVLKESNNLEARIGYLALIDKGWAIEQYIDFRKRFYLPTPEAFEHVKKIENGIIQFKPESHGLLLKIVNDFKKKMAGDNCDLFEDAS